MTPLVNCSCSGPYDLWGQERNRWVCMMAQLNLVIHGIHAEVVTGDAFRDDMFPQLRADSVMAVPPFGPRKLPSADELAEPPSVGLGGAGVNDADAAWIEHCLFHLADSGKAVLVLPNRILFAGGRAGRIRQRIVSLASLMPCCPTSRPLLLDVHCFFDAGVRQRQDRRQRESQHRH